MREKLEAAIDVLKQRLAEQEHRVTETKKLINELCDAAGIEPLYAVTEASAQPTVTSITGDTFYGDASVTTAARRYLEMRRAANLGPASTREVYEALKNGNFPFATDDANNAMTNIRATMRKNSSIFHRLPDGRWGMRGWYDRIKSAGDDGDGKPTRRSPKKKTAARKKRAAAKTELRKPRAAASQAKRGSAQEPPERKEEPHVVHEPEVAAPAAKAA
jgi:hypothetical protein